MNTRTAQKEPTAMLAVLKRTDGMAANGMNADPSVRYFGGNAGGISVLSGVNAQRLIRANVSNNGISGVRRIIEEIHAGRLSLADAGNAEELEELPAADEAEEIRKLA